MSLRVVPEEGMGARPDPRAFPDARHSFRASPNPRTTSCVKCGRVEADSIHAYLDLGHRASVSAHLSTAANHASQGDFAEAVREARVAIRLAGLED